MYSGYFYATDPSLYWSSTSTTSYVRSAADCMKSSQIFNAMLSGFRTLFSGATGPPTETRAMWMPSFPYVLSRDRTRLR